MSDIQELERRKRELELKRDIARLERQEARDRAATDIAEGLKQRGSRIARWHWGWVAPLTLFGLYIIGLGYHYSPIVVALGLLMLVPAALKFIGIR